VRWLVRGDIDGFFGLALDNLVQLLLIATLCRNVLGFGDELLYGRVLPGVALSLVVGNLYYAWSARRLAVATGRDDVCALPYGINTVSLLAHVFLVMLPAKLAAEAAGAADPVAVAWQAGLAACVGSGLIELGGAFVAERIRRATPRAALLATLASIALTFIAMGFFFRTYARPVVGLVTLGIVLVTYFGRVRFRGGLPGGLVAVAVGTALAWATGLAPVGALPQGGLHGGLPVPALGELASALQSGMLLSFVSVIVPMGLFNLIGSLQNIESAEAAGDAYATRPALVVNGIGTLVAAGFGSVFPTTLYIGHPAWKAMGARAGYSVLNAAAMAVICLAGLLPYIAAVVPIEAGMAILLWIGLVITAQAFQATPARHAPAVVLGVLPGVAAFCAFLIKSTLRASGWGVPGGPSMQERAPELVEAFGRADIWIVGTLALEQGFIFTAMILAAATVELIERRFAKAALWCFAAALLCAVGLMHSYRFTPGDAVVQLSPAWPWAIGYAIMGAVFLMARWVTEPGDEH
jgi:AGZA family xanthine/uracil permease-like MFS transporter